MLASLFALALTCAADAPAADPAPESAPVTTSDDLSRAERASAALAPFAHAAQTRRIVTGLAYEAAAAGLIGAAITYVAVAEVDNQLSAQDKIDTQIAGWVVAGAAVPAVVLGVLSFTLRSPVEERLDALASGTDVERDARVDAVIADLEREVDAVPVARIATGTTLGVLGLGAGALGAMFLILPHTVVRAGPVSHATGAELIGIGTAGLGFGIATAVLSSEAEDLQLAALRGVSQAH
jgi:hypothetical protein